MLLDGRTRGTATRDEDRLVVIALYCYVDKRLRHVVHVAARQRVRIIATTREDELVGEQRVAVVQ